MEKRSGPPQRQWTQDRPLREEFASAAIQGSAAALSAGGLVYLVAQGLQQPDTLALPAVVVYGASMFIAFLASALYHGIQHPRARRVLQEIDHCTIFLLIAGTYTPLALLPLRQHGGVALLALIWSLAIAGIALRLGRPRLFQRIAVPLYVLMGWLGLGWGVVFHREIGSVPLLLMFAGGISYTGGLLFYFWHGRPFSNSMWHLCVVAGSAWFFVAITRFVPA